MATKTQQQHTHAMKNLNHKSLISVCSSSIIVKKDDRENRKVMHLIKHRHISEKEAILILSRKKLFETLAKEQIQRKQHRKDIFSEAKEHVRKERKRRLIEGRKTTERHLKIKHSSSVRNISNTSTGNKEVSNNKKSKNNKLTGHGPPGSQLISNNNDNDNCVFFNRTGRCFAQDKCLFLHDKTKVTVCRKYLTAGSCGNKACTLRHEFDQVSLKYHP